MLEAVMLPIWEVTNPYTCDAVGRSLLLDLEAKVSSYANVTTFAPTAVPKFVALTITFFEALSSISTAMDGRFSP